MRTSIISLLLSGLCACSQAPREAPSATIAFVDVNVVPMDEEHVLSHQTVIVEAGRITHLGAADQTELPEDAQVIDGTDSYLMPGLADMHVHASKEDFLLYVAAGVTTIRNLNGDQEHLTWRAQIREGSLLGPTLYTTAPLLTGPDTRWRIKAVPDSPDDARRIVRAQHGAGYDFIKIYDGLTSEIYEATMDEAARLGIRAVGHIPEAVGLEGVLAAGQASLEHAEKIVYTFFNHQFDETNIPKAASLIREAGAWVCPTLAVQESFMQIDQGHFDELRKQPAMRYVSPEIMAWWTDFAQGSSHPPPSHNAEQGANHGKQGNAGGGFYSFQVRLVKGLHEAGVPILAGTDTPNPAMVPGFSLHEELRNLVQAGLTPYEALAAATRDAATFLQASDEWGTIAVGKRADLILLAANPLENVTHTTNRLGVMVNGQWFSQAQLQRMLDAYASSLAETPQ